MIVPIERLGKVFGDRVLVKRLGRPEKIRGIYVPQSYVKDNPKEQQLWYGIIVKFGIDSRYSDAYGLKEGDLVGINELGLSNASFVGDDANEYFWVMEEFLAVVDKGRIKSYRDDIQWINDEGNPGLLPLGQYSVVEPYPEQEKRGGIILPETGKEGQRTGKVVAVSMGEVKHGELAPLNVTNGADVLYGKYSGCWSRLGKDNFLLVKEEDIIAELQTSKDSTNKEKKEEVCA